MTHAMSAASDQRAAQARDDADTAVEMSGELPDVDRPTRVAAVAVATLGRHAPASSHHDAIRDALHRLAWAVAELAVRLDGEQAATPLPVDEPVPYVPALDHIRRADDYPGG